MTFQPSCLHGRADEESISIIPNLHADCRVWVFVQICGGYADSMARCAQLLEEHAQVDFVDVNMGCPIDLVCNKFALLLLLLGPYCVPLDLP